MAERVPANSLGDARTACCGAYVPFEEAVRPIGLSPTHPGTGKDPVFRLFVRCDFFPPPKVFGHVAVERYGLARGFSLTLPNDLVEDGTCHRYDQGFKVHILPLEGEELTHPQSGSR